MSTEEYIDCMEMVEEDPLTYEEDLKNTIREEAGEFERIEDWEFEKFFDNELEKTLLLKTSSRQTSNNNFKLIERR